MGICQYWIENEKYLSCRFGQVPINFRCYQYVTNPSQLLKPSFLPLLIFAWFSMLSPTAITGLYWTNDLSHQSGFDYFLNWLFIREKLLKNAFGELVTSLPPRFEIGTASHIWLHIRATNSLMLFSNTWIGLGALFWKQSLLLLFASKCFLVTAFWILQKWNPTVMCSMLL